MVQALRQGDEQAFMVLVEQYQTPLLRLAMVYVSDLAAAEDAVQETWLGVLRGLHRARSKVRGALERYFGIGDVA